MSEPIAVSVRAGDCPCPGAPHTSETVYLEPELTVPMASAAYLAMRMAGDSHPGSVAAQEAALIGVYLPLGIRSWTFLETVPEDEREKDGPRVRMVPVSAGSIERVIPWDKGGLEVANEADGLYGGRLMRPLVARMSKLLPPSSTDDSMSPSPPSGRRHPKHSRRSSLNGSAGKPSVDQAR